MAEVQAGLSAGQVQALIDSTMPKPATTTPAAEALGGNAGTNPSKFAQEGHQHPRLTSTKYATLSADGTVTHSFSRTFVNKPGINITETDAAGNQPLVCVVQSWVQDGNGAYTGCVIKGYRSTILPMLSPVSTLAILSGVITGVNAINTALSAFNLFGGSAAGATVSVIAIARSDVASN